MFYCNTPNLGSVWASCAYGLNFQKMCKFWPVNCRKMRLAARVRPDPLRGRYSVPPSHWRWSGAATGAGLAPLLVAVRACATDFSDGDDLS